MHDMGKTNLVKLLCLLLLMVSSAALSTGAPLVVIIISSEAEAYQQVTKNFEAEMHKKRPEIQFLQMSSSDVNKDLLSIKENQPALVFALGSDSVRKAGQQLSDRPMLATMVLDNNAMQGQAHATAITLDMPIVKQLQWHRRFLPQAKRVGVLYNPQNNQKWVVQASKIADILGLEIVAVSVESPRHITSALKSLNRRVDSILAIPDKMVYSSNTAKAVMLFSFRNRIPFIGLSGAWVKAGALYALDWDYSDLGRQSADIALKILNGTKPEKIKPDVPGKSVYQLNLKTAKHMKLKINRKLIAAAEKVYQ